MNYLGNIILNLLLESARSEMVSLTMFGYFCPANIRFLYYNAFIRSHFSYCLLFWFPSERFGRYKIIDKVDYLIK